MRRCAETRDTRECSQEETESVSRADGRPRVCRMQDSLLAGVDRNTGSTTVQDGTKWKNDRRIIKRKNETAGLKMQKREVKLLDTCKRFQNCSFDKLTSWERTRCRKPLKEAKKKSKTQT